MIGRTYTYVLSLWYSLVMLLQEPNICHLQRRERKRLSKKGDYEKEGFD